VNIKPITHSTFLVLFVLIVLAILLLNGAVSADPAQTNLVQELQVPPADPGQPAMINIPTKAVTFETYPDGTPIIEDTILLGDEFRAKGIVLSGSPEGSYCEDATSAAISVDPHSVGIPISHFLTTSEPLVWKCQGVPVKITFVVPVHEVELTFYGAATVYTLKAYDQADNLLGTTSRLAVLFTENTISMSTCGYDYSIKYITFGSTGAITAVQKVAFSPMPPIYLPIILK